MLRNSWVWLALALAAPKGASYTNGSIDLHPICDAVPGNLVVNCGFETGAFTGWVQSGDLSFTDVTAVAAHSGSFGARFGPTTFGFISQTLPTTPGQTYRLSFWLRNVGQPSEFGIYWDGSLVTDWSNVADINFAQLTHSGFIASSGATEIVFGFFNVPDFFYIDDIVVEQYPP